MDNLTFPPQSPLTKPNGLENTVDVNYVQYAVDRWNKSPPDPDFKEILLAEPYYPPET